MRKIILITFCFLFFCCNTNQKNPVKWSDDDKDLVFQQCIAFAIEVDNMDSEKANNYCYCSLDIIIENFENKEVAQNQISLDNELRLMWDETCR